MGCRFDIGTIALLFLALAGPAPVQPGNPVAGATAPEQGKAGLMQLAQFNPCPGGRCRR